MTGGPLDGFHPLVREWFLGRYPGPTPIQAEAWPRIAAGEHLLALAPTGSGKTLTAFLGAISRLAGGELPADECGVLYVSPLKALGEDLRRNLEEPLAEIGALFAARGAPFPEIRVATRTGDTSPAERRRMIARPPSILVTTPESLGLILDSPVARNVLAAVRLLVLDEVHSLADDKRGALLACAVGRLALLAGEFQRLALSATVRSPEAIAAFVGGSVLERGPNGAARYRRRAVSIAAPPASKRIEIGVEFPEAAPSGDRGDGAGGARYAAAVRAVLERLRAGRRLIVFTDARRRAERLAFLLNEAGGEGTAWAHHGSLSREARRAVEQRLRSGELRCVVATASLELGIDIGGVDEVVLAGSPSTASSTLQRVGRSGHGVGEVSRGTIMPFHGMDLLLAAAAAEAVEERAVEEIRPPSCPLDILAQVLLSLCAESPRTVDELYDIIRSFPPFELLTRPLFDATVEMLAGRYRDTRLRELEPRITVDRATGVAAARDGARTLLYSSGGAIPDRGHYSMRVKGSRARIGELDEEFVWERKPGDAFTFGARSWRIVEIGHEAVEVVPLGREADFMPFWRAEARFRSPELVGRSLAVLDRLAPLGAEGGAALLEARGLSRGAAEALAGFVEAQKAAGRGADALPGSARIVVEENADPARRGDATRLVIHTLRGGAVNEALALGLAAAWEEAEGLPIQVLSDDDSILALVPAIASSATDGPAVRSTFDANGSGTRADALGVDGGPVAEAPDRGSGRGGAVARIGEIAAAENAARLLAGLAAPGRLEALARSRLEGTGLFGAQFRENAGRSLLLPRGRPGGRIPLWVTRLRAKKLFEAVRSSPDFPVVVETWRSCLADLLDLEGARELVEGVAGGRVAVGLISTRSPSPFAREAVWKETNEFLYRGDAIEARAASSVSDRVVAEALRSSRLRPRLDPALVEDFERRLKRLLPGWAPGGARELAEWARERVLIPAGELPEILGLSPSLAAELEADPGCDGRLRRITLPGATEEVLVHSERALALTDDPGSHVAEWLRREGPVPAARVAELFGLGEEALADLVEALVEEGTAVEGAFLRDSEDRAVIDAQNLELLLRRSRRAARPSVEPRPAADLARLVAAVQGLGRGGAGTADRGEGAGAEAAFKAAGAEAIGAAARIGNAPAAAGGAPLRPRDDGERAVLAALGSLAGYPAPAGHWETELLPARVPGFRPADLDAAFARGRWQWFGTGRESVAFAAAEDLDLFIPRDRAAGSPERSRLVPPGDAALDFWALREASGLKSKEAALALWEEAWAGLSAADTFEAVREGIANGFGRDLAEAGAEIPAAAPFGARRRIPAALRRRWREGVPVPGRWFRLDLDEAELDAEDPLEEEDRAARRVRLLVGRYGLICRSLLERESPALRWGELFPALRRMELAGEILAGRFFEGLEGPQFIGVEALRLFSALEAEAPRGPIWLCALDPAASPAYGAEGRDGLLPTRTAANRLCLLEGRVVAASSRGHRELSLGPPPEHPDIPAILGGFASARFRAVRPERRISLETVNGAGAADCPYAAALRDIGFESDRGRMTLW